jgi:hypothetical protein
LCILKDFKGFLDQGAFFKGQIKDDCRLVQKTYSGTLDIPLMMMMTTTTTMMMMI